MNELLYSQDCHLVEFVELPAYSHQFAGVGAQVVAVPFARFSAVEKKVVTITNLFLDR